MRYELASAASGLAWGAIGFWFFRDTNLRESAWAGLLASPGIGLCIGVLVVRSNLRGKLGALALALVNLYLAVALFAVSIGLAHVAFHWGELPVPESKGRAWFVVEMLLSTLWGLTLSGLILVFLPLSWANHVLLGSRANRNTA